MYEQLDEEALSQEEPQPVKERAFAQWIAISLPENDDVIWSDFRDVSCWSRCHSDHSSWCAGVALLCKGSRRQPRSPVAPCTGESCRSLNPSH